MNDSKRRIFRDPKTKELYNQYKDKIVEGPLNGRSLTEIFTLALTMGFNNLERKPLNEKKGFIRPESFGSILPTLMRSIAIHETENIEILTDEEEVFNISEEYGNAGIKYLSSKYSENTEEFTEILLREILEKIESSDIINKIDIIIPDEID
jgi:dnd system-associated protein 4